MGETGTVRAELQYGENHAIDLVIAGVASLVAEPTPIDDWARAFGVPDKNVPGACLDGAQVQRILGIRSKSWAPETFRDPGCVVDTARKALERAGLGASDIDAVLVVTCTPYQVQLDQDAFALTRRLGVRDHVLPLVLGAGCAGLARAVALVKQLAGTNFLVVSYNLSSLIACSPLYQKNDVHPFGNALWMSGALFSDGASAVVLKRVREHTGVAFYSRDALAFGDGPGFDDCLIHYPGGGASAPPGLEGSAELSCYGMNGSRVKEYYMQGMTLNHERLCALRPDWLGSVKRLYTHQASPALTNAFLARMVEVHGIASEKLGTNVEKYGNLVASSTVKLLDDDLRDGTVESGDEVCFSVVGSGPERGGLVIPVACS